MKPKAKTEPKAKTQLKAQPQPKKQPNYIAILLARDVSGRRFAELTAELKAVLERFGLRFKGAAQFLAVPPDGAPQKGRVALELPLRGRLKDPAALRAALLKLADKLGVDVILQREDRYRHPPKLAVFDMDSTLIEEEVIDELAAEAGAGAEAAAITAAAMRGELDFTESLRQRVAMLKGLQASALDKVADRVRLTEGAEQLVHTLQFFECKTAIISGGFINVALRLQQRLRIDFMYGNELEIVDGVLTGRLEGSASVVDGETKARLLRNLAKREGIAMEETLCVGDGANDVPMLRIAGIGVAFRAKPEARRNAEFAISTFGLEGILYLMGLNEREQAAYRI